jgi:protein gp37
MADTSKIEWTDATWNPIVGCSIVSPGCTNCYAMRMAARLQSCIGDGKHLVGHYDGTVKRINGHAVWTGKVALAPDHILTAPLRWQKPRRIFVNSMGDLFHESIPDAWIDRVFAVMALSPQHEFQVLTKRAKRMRDYVCHISEPGFGARDRIDNVVLGWRLDRTHKEVFRSGRLDVVNDGYDACERWPLPNVWLGVSAERQQEADERIPHLLQTPAAVRFVSAEPLLGPIDFRRAFYVGEEGGGEHVGSKRQMIGWIIVGGESGPKARPMHPQWARDIRDQCQAAGVPFFFKQWGEYIAVAPNGPGQGAPLRERQDEIAIGDVVMRRVGKKAAGRLLDGREHNDMPVAG